jgi:hypothetical protein
MTSGGDHPACGRFGATADRRKPPARRIRHAIPSARSHIMTRAPIKPAAPADRATARAETLAKPTRAVAAPARTGRNAKARTGKTRSRAGR